MADKRRRRAVVALGENPLGRRIYDPAGFDVGGGRWRDRENADAGNSHREAGCGAFAFKKVR